MLEFKTLDFSDFDVINKYVNDLEFYSDFNFLSLFSWSLHSQTSYCIDDNCLYISLPDYITQDMSYTFFPKNNYLESFLKYCDWLTERSLPLKFSLIPQVVKEKLIDSLPLDKYSAEPIEDRDSFDYVISPTKISLALGGEFSDFRYKIKRFEKEFGDNIKIRRLNPNSDEDIVSCIGLAHKWASKDRNNPTAHDDEIDAYIRFLQAARQLDRLMTVLFTYNDEIVAFVACEVLDNNRAIGHFLKYDPAYPGIYYYMVNYVCNELHSLGVKELNIEQDLGIPGLRQAKMYLRPIRFLKKYTLSVSVKN